MARGKYHTSFCLLQLMRLIVLRNVNKFPLNHVPIRLAGFEPRAWEVRIIGAVGVGLRFKGDAARCVKRHIVFGFHRIIEMLC